MQKSEDTKIDILLKELNISQTDFARKLGTSTSAVYNWKNRDLGSKVIKRIIEAFPSVNPAWLMSGEGDVLRYKVNEIEVNPMDWMKDEFAKFPASRKESEFVPSKEEPVEEETRPRLPVTVAAGRIAEYYGGILRKDCIEVPVNRQYPAYDFTMIVKGNSMEPKFESGDEIACRRVYSNLEWGRTYVLDTRDGAFLKRVYDHGDKIRCVSYNPEYPDMLIDKNDIIGFYSIEAQLRI